MADSLHELLAPYLAGENAATSPRDFHTTTYLSRLCTLSLSDLTSTEPASLLYSAQSQLRNLQALSKRSRKAVISSSSELANLATLLPTFEGQAEALRIEIPTLEGAAASFAEKYDRSTENEVLDRRKRAALLSRNVDRVSDILDLPSLLSSTVTAGQSGSANGAASAGLATSHASALDIQAHIKRLGALYPHSGLVGFISAQAEEEMQNLATILITSLQSPSLKLAPAMRTVGYLKRVTPELLQDDHNLSKPGLLSTKFMTLATSPVNETGSIGSLFLICRLHALNQTLEALDPLQELADQETLQRKRQKTATKSSKESTSTSAVQGSQSERFLKRYIEIFREQSFGILSMYKSIFPSNLPTLDSTELDSGESQGPLTPLPSPVSSFALHLVGMLEVTLREYMPNVVDQGTRESLFTQVLYCAGSLGRLGAEFAMMVALLDEELQLDAVGSGEAAEPSNGGAIEFEEDSSQPEWVAVMQKHRVQASRLEVLARGVSSGRKTSMEVPAASSASPMTAV